MFCPRFHACMNVAEGVRCEVLYRSLTALTHAGSTTAFFIGHSVTCMCTALHCFCGNGENSTFLLQLFCKCDRKL